MIKKLIKEPLFQFIIIGIGLFFIFKLANKETAYGEVTIDDQLLAELSIKWENLRKRQPTANELMGLLATYVEDEVFYQEAIAKGLDQNDEIIKRRLSQKMEFISDEMASTLQPSIENFKSYYNDHSEDYMKPMQVSFKHVFFSFDKRSNARADAEAALIKNDPTNSGDFLSLPSSYKSEYITKIGSDFGLKFSNALQDIETGKWVGPIESGFGVHLVYIDSKNASSLYPFEEVVAKVRNDYNYNASNEFKEKFISELISSYEINIDVSNQQLKKLIDAKY